MPGTSRPGDARPPEITHPSLQAPRVPGRSRRRFDAELQPATPAPSRAPGLLSVTAEVAGAAGPFGGVVSAGISALSGGPADGRDRELDRMWEMQRDNQTFNLEYLALQESAQAENRRFTTMSNLMKARHDTAKIAIGNIRV